MVTIVTAASGRIALSTGPVSNRSELPQVDVVSRCTTRDALTRLHAGEADPPCLECGGVLKTATVMFGQSLDPVVLDRAFEAAQGATDFVVIGMSLLVQPAASLVDVAATTPARVIIVNAEPRPTTTSRQKRSATRYRRPYPT